MTKTTDEIAVDVAALREQFLPARDRAVDALIAWLEIGDRLGETQQGMMMQFMGAFQQKAALQ